MSFLTTGDPFPLLLARSEAVDTAIAAEYAQTLAPAFPTGLALLAVGGFGRRELFPHSDVDLLFLTLHDPDDPQREALSLALRNWWDAGLRLSHSVRSVADCCRLQEGNAELSISLLDARLLLGDEGLFADFQQRFQIFRERQRRSLLEHLAHLTATRREKFQNTIYHLEPDVKETPGGLRDLHFLHWLAQLQGQPSPEFSAAHRLLCQFRCVLHLAAGRDQNRLTFEQQDGLMAQPFNQYPAPEAAMRDYFRHARAVDQSVRVPLDDLLSTQSGLLQGYRDWRSRLSTNEFTVSRDRILLRSPSLLTADPRLLYRLALFQARHGLALAPSAQQQIAQHAPAPLTWAHLQPILQQPRASRALRSWQEAGLLTQLLPDWVGIDCLVVRDFYHRYTVDEHTLRALEAIEIFESTRFSSLFQEQSRPDLLRLALLLHDLGKGAGTGDHVAVGHGMVSAVLHRLAVPAADRSTIQFLVDEHLMLSSVMTGRDISDPAVAEDLAHRLGTVERLSLLTLLTYADISAVHPGALTPWRKAALWRVYAVVHAELTRELSTDRIQTSALPSFVQGFPTRYLHTQDAASLQAHAALVEQSRKLGAAVDLKHHTGFSRLTIATQDRPFLFAALAGTLASFGLEIVHAEAYNNAQGTALDLISFSDPLRTLELNPSEIDHLRQSLFGAATGQLDVSRLLRDRRRPLGRIAVGIVPHVLLDPTVSATATLLQISAVDRPALLYDLAAAIGEAGCSIDVLLVDTQGQRAQDVFYLTAGGKPLTEAQQSHLEQQLWAVVRPSV